MSTSTKIVLTVVVVLIIVAIGLIIGFTVSKKQHFQPTPFIDPACHGNTRSCAGSGRCAKNLESVYGYHIAEPPVLNGSCGYFSSTLNQLHPSGFHVHGKTHNTHPDMLYPKNISNDNSNGFALPMLKYPILDGVRI